MQEGAHHEDAKYFILISDLRVVKRTGPLGCVPRTRVLYSAPYSASPSSTPASTWLSGSAGAMDPRRTETMYSVYSVLTIVAFVVGAPYFLYQAVRRRSLTSLGQRLGFLPRSLEADGRVVVWIQAVSVGEVRAARSLVAGLRQAHPRLRIVLSTTTVTGQEVARSDHPDLDVFYFPLDLPWIVARALDLVRPSLFVMVETELWPNVLRACRRRGIRTALVNARISPRSFPRYVMIRPVFGRVLSDIDRFCAQDEQSASRLVEMGADRSRVSTTGSLKFDSAALGDVSPGSTGRDVLRHFRVAADRLVIVAASTRRGEEDIVLDAFARARSVAPGCMLLLVPRHPERAQEVVELVARAGFSVRKRSELRLDGEPTEDVVVVDTVGELARLYGLATVVFVGGSLVDWGGHNILEPAVWGKAIVFGPHMQNFAEIAQTFLAHGAACQVDSADGFSEVLVRLLGDPSRRAELGRAAAELVQRNRGAVQKTLTVLDEILPRSAAPTATAPVTTPSQVH